MDTQSPSTEIPSFRRIVTRYWRQVYAYRLQWYRLVLNKAATLHRIICFAKLFGHHGERSARYTSSVRLDFLAFFFSAVTIYIWWFLFRDPAEFLLFKRPGRAYRWVVCGTVALTTLPNSLVHIWALKVALRLDILFQVVQVSAIAVFVPLVGLVWLMAWKFLLGLDESNEDFEPIVKNSTIITGQERQQLTQAVELYRDYVSTPSTPLVIANGYLSQAYEEQRLTAQESPQDQSLVGLVELPQQEEVHDEVEEPEQASDATLTTRVVNPPRCQTIARFHYLTQSQTGPHSWLFSPLIPLIFSTYATILLIGLPIWIHDDRQYRFRTPSPTIKMSLYLPLGLYLLSLYALKHRLRASLFERFDIPLPEPWKEILYILPSWARTAGNFKNLDTGEITVHDPCLRAFPRHAFSQPVLIRTREYIEAYNANQGACTTFWGHSGRSVKTELHCYPAIQRIGFVSFATYLICKGYWYIVFYKVPNVYEEILKHPKTITVEDIARLLRILRFWEAFTLSGVWFFALVIVFATACIGSMLVFIFGTAWKYVQQEKKERIMSGVQEPEQIRREGRIRLE